MLLLFTPPAIAIDGQSQTTDFTSDIVFPNLSEMGSRYLQLTSFVEKSNVRLKLLADAQEIENKAQEWRVKIVEMQQKITELGNPEGWYVDRLVHYSSRFDLARKGLEDIQKILAARFEEIQDIRTRQKKDKIFWRTWAENLKSQDEKAPEKTFKQVTVQLATLEENLQKTSAILIPLQEQVSMLEQSTLEALDRFSNSLEQLRKATFRKNDSSFFSLNYYSQFSPTLWTEIGEGIRSALVVDFETLENNSWVFLLFLLVLFPLSIGLLKYKSNFSSSKEWHFVLDHPWAAGFFIAAVITGTFLPSTSTEINFALTVIGVVGATILASALIQSRQQTLILKLAACVLIISTTLRFIALPQPLFRLYIALLALVAIPLLTQQVYLSRKDQTVSKQSFFRSLLRFFVVVFLLSLAGQATGYVNFSVWLFRSVFETGMIVLFVVMGLRLGNGSIDFLLSRESLTKYKFFKKYRQEIAARMETILKLAVYFYALLNLMPVWRIFNGLGEVWNYFGEASVSIGTTQITLHMVFLATAALFLSSQISWLLQAMTETQVFHRKSVDRGVLDAIKKLIHYGVILFGFLIALSFLGMNLQHFVIVLGALGVGIGFGLQDIVNNFLSGIILLFERPVKVGDGILVDGEYGTVKHIGLRSTIVETLDQSELIVPNSQMISQKVTNWTLSTRRVRVVIEVGVAYGSNLEQVRAILKEVGDQHPEVLDDPQPAPLFIEFGESSLNFELRLWINNIDNRPRIKNEALLSVDRRFREAGIEISFPQRDLHLRSVASGIFPTQSESAE